jgi:lysophospholipase L1-like esterase
MAAPVMKILRCAVIALVCLSLSNCGKPPLTKLETDSVILAFGDSLTAGVGVNSQYSYPHVLSELTGVRVINAGVSGEATADGLVRFEQLLSGIDAPTEIDLIILLEGGNDILRNLDPDQTKANLAAMIELATAAEIQVVLIGVPKKALFSDSAPFYTELAEQYQLVFEQEIIASLIRNPSMKSDSVHFNRRGYRALAQAIQQILESNGAL